MSDPQGTTEQETAFLTVDEVASYLRISKCSVYRIMERRDMPFYRLARKVLFRASDVRDYLTKCRVGPFEEPVPRRKPNPVV